MNGRTPGGGASALGKTTWVELKLFLREPLTVIFTLALPLVSLFILGGVFGNTPDPEGAVYRGVGAMDYYVPAYIGLVVASVGLVGLPVHLAGYRERGVLRRFRASSVPATTVVGSQVAVTVVIAIVGSVLLVIAARLAYTFQAPHDPARVILAFFLGALAFSALGVLLGALLPTARAAQGAGILLWFIMLFIGGAGPPPEVLTDSMAFVGRLTPLRHVIFLLQDPWLGFGWNWTETAIVAGIAAVAGVVSLRFFRWE